MPDHQLAQSSTLTSSAEGIPSSEMPAISMQRTTRSQSSPRSTPRSPKSPMSPARHQSSSHQYTNAQTPVTECLEPRENTKPGRKSGPVWKYFRPLDSKSHPQVECKHCHTVLNSATPRRNMLPHALKCPEILPTEKQLLRKEYEIPIVASPSVALPREARAGDEGETLPTTTRRRPSSQTLWHLEPKRHKSRGDEMTEETSAANDRIYTLSRSDVAIKAFKDKLASTLEVADRFRFIQLLAMNQSAATMYCGMDDECRRFFVQEFLSGNTDF